jgi:hypothetical protein
MVGLVNSSTWILNPNRLNGSTIAVILSSLTKADAELTNYLSDT